jgi:citrate synthase
MAARMAAAVRADPYAVVLTGLGTMSGALHAGASLGVEELLAEVDEPAQVPAALGRRVRRGVRISGFGHQVYRDGDGRATALLDRLRLAVPRHPMLAVADAFVAELRDRLGLRMNVDFALAVFGRVAGLASGSGEAIFAIARTAGWLAHAIEEYTEPTRLRLRATYTGPV